LENKKDKDVKISWNVWALLQAKTTELKIKTGKRVTLKSYIDNLVLKNLSKKEEEI